MKRFFNGFLKFKKTVGEGAFYVRPEQVSAITEIDEETVTLNVQGILFEVSKKELTKYQEEN